MSISPGYGLIAGVTKENAVAALAAAAEAGISADEVIVHDGGFLVPLAVLDVHQANLQKAAATEGAKAPIKRGAKKTPDPTDESSSN